MIENDHDTDKIKIELGEFHAIRPISKIYCDVSAGKPQLGDYIPTFLWALMSESERQFWNDLEEEEKENRIEEAWFTGPVDFLINIRFLFKPAGMFNLKIKAGDDAVLLS